MAGMVYIGFVISGMVGGPAAVIEHAAGLGIEVRHHNHDVARAQQVLELNAFDVGGQHPAQARGIGLQLQIPAGEACRDGA